MFFVRGLADHRGGHQWQLTDDVVGLLGVPVMVLGVLNNIAATHRRLQKGTGAGAIPATAPAAGTARPWGGRPAYRAIPSRCTAAGSTVLTGPWPDTAPGVAIGTVKSRSHRAHHHLAERLEHLAA